MSKEKEKTRKISKRTKWTIIVLLLFALLGVASGLLHQKVGENYSYDTIENAAEEIVK